MTTARQGTKQIVGQDDKVVIREASAADTRALFRLAVMDEKPPLHERVLLAEAGGEILAAVSIESGHSIASPWRRTGELVKLLELRAEQLRDGRDHSQRGQPRPRLVPLRA